MDEEFSYGVRVVVVVESSVVGEDAVVRVDIGVVLGLS